MLKIIYLINLHNHIFQYIWFLSYSTPIHIDEQNHSKSTTFTQGTSAAKPLIGLFNHKYTPIFLLFCYENSSTVIRDIIQP